MAAGAASLAEVGDGKGIAKKTFAPAGVGRREFSAYANQQRGNPTVDQSQDKRRIAALEAILKTLLPEYYLMQSGGLPKQTEEQ